MSRFLCYHAACAVVGAKVGKKLGLWDFSVAGIKDFIVRHIKRQLDKITEYRVSPEDRFAAMIADFNGKILVTYRFDSLDARKKNTMSEMPLVKIGSTIVGRYAIGSPGTKDCAGDPGRLYIAISAINKWCQLNELNAAEVRKEWLNAGLVETQRGADKNGEKLVKLGRGVPEHALPPARCVEFIVSKVRDAVPGVPTPSAEVIPLKEAV